MKILLAPHNDDEALFATAIILRYHPLVIVVTDGHKHAQHGVSVEQRRKESVEAMKVLSAPVLFLGLPDTGFTKADLIDRLKDLDPDEVYAPQPDTNGNPQHTIVGEVAMELWPDRTRYYSTYKITDLTPQGRIKIDLTEAEMKLKEEALSKYTSQHRLNASHFAAVKGQPEFIC